MSNEQVELIRKDALIPITVGAGFYARLQEVLLYIVKGKTQEELSNATEQIKSGTVNEPWIKHYETMLALCQELDSQARQNNLTVKTNIDSLAD